MASHHQPVAKIKCPRCHEDIQDGQSKLFLADQPYHYECWINSIIGPAHYAAHKTLGQKSDAVGEERIA